MTRNQSRGWRRHFAHAVLGPAPMATATTTIENDRPSEISDHPATVAFGRFRADPEVHRDLPSSQFRSSAPKRPALTYSPPMRPQRFRRRRRCGTLFRLRPPRSTCYRACPRLPGAELTAGRVSGHVGCGLAAGGKRAISASGRRRSTRFAGPGERQATTGEGSDTRQHLCDVCAGWRTCCS